MIIDNDFNIFLVEVNMSPNLQAGPDRIQNRYSFENILYNLFNLLSIGTPYDKTEFKFPNGHYEIMVANPDSMSVLPETCLSSKCETCENKDCELCWKCFDSTTKYEVMQAYSEGMNVGDFKRLFPPDKKFMNKVDDMFWKNLLPRNRLNVMWYVEMCKKNKRFC